MKIARILLFILSLSMPVALSAYPRSYYYPHQTVTYCNSKQCHCHSCKPTYDYYYCQYCYDSYYGCPECDSQAGKIIIIGTIIAAACYLIDKVIKS